MRKNEQDIRSRLHALRGTEGRILIVAHRGCSGRAPENTLAAFRMALELGADMIECDVRLTRDAKVVTFHDRTLNRTTNGKGPVENYTLDELTKLDAGSWFHRQFSGERIPTLSEVLGLLDSRAALNIELKADPGKRGSHTLLMEQVLQEIRNHRAENRVFLGSFNHRLMKEIKERNPQLTTAIIYKAVRDFASRPSHLVSRARANAFVCGRWWLSRKLIKDLKGHQIPLFVYTVDRERDVERMIRLNVDGVITNFPDLVVRVLKKSARA